uniref:Uncharacterized protein n=1 Tax=Arundo donax TaxID=35708 RepID=A0A0A8XWE5_ARUDO
MLIHESYCFMHVYMCTVPSLFAVDRVDVKSQILW